LSSATRKVTKETPHGGGRSEKSAKGESKQKFEGGFF
jgi:hypothetical protein